MERVIITRYKSKEKITTLLSSKKFSSSFTPLLAVEIYKKRHYIENEGFRELKQGYKIDRFPSRKFSASLFSNIIILMVYNFIKLF